MPQSVFLPLVLPLPTEETNPKVAVFRPSAAVHTVVTLTNASQVVLVENLDRRRVILHNDSGAAIFVRFGATCTTSAFSFRITPNDSYFGPMGDYTGPISAVRASGTSPLQVSEVVS